MKFKERKRKKTFGKKEVVRKRFMDFKKRKEVRRIYMVEK